MSDRIEFQLRAIVKHLDMINVTLVKQNTLLYELVRPKPKPVDDEIPQMIEEQKKILSPYQQMTEAMNETERMKKRPPHE